MVNVKEKNEVYKCNVCGNMVETIHAGAGEMVCCDQKMELLNENSTDAATEKHVPVVEETATGIKVSVGSVLHPMEEKHFIEWIEVLTIAGKTYRQYLNPGDQPVAEFCVKKADVAKVREFCNLHGLWKA